MAPYGAQDMHRAWTGAAHALANIWSLHHQRRPSVQGACKFEGAILQLLPNQAHAPRARAMIDIAQHADGTPHLSDCDQSLSFCSFGVNEPVGASQRADTKTLNCKLTSCETLSASGCDGSLPKWHFR